MIRSGSRRAAQQMMGGGESSSSPLDGVSNVIAAFSASRPMLSTYTGDLYTLSGSDVTAWADQTENNDLTVAAPPSLDAASVGTRDAISFDGTEYLRVANDSVNAINTSSIALFVVYQRSQNDAGVAVSRARTNVALGRYWIDSRSVRSEALMGFVQDETTSRVIATSVPPIGSPALGVLVVNRATGYVRVFYNGTEPTSPIALTDTDTNWYAANMYFTVGGVHTGATHYYPWHGHVSEVVLIKGDIVIDDINTVGSGMADWHGLTWTTVT